MNQIIPLRTMVDDVEKIGEQDFDVDISDDELKNAQTEQRLREPIKQMQLYTKYLQQKNDFVDCHFIYYQHPTQYDKTFCSAVDCLTCGFTYIFKSATCYQLYYKCIRRKEPDGIIQEHIHSDKNLKFQKSKVHQHHKKKHLFNKVMHTRSMKQPNDSDNKLVQNKAPPQARHQFKQVLFNLKLLKATLKTNSKLFQFLPTFVFINLIITVIPIFGYIIVMFCYFGQRERDFLYVFINYHKREVSAIASNQNMNEKRSIKTKLYLFFILFIYNISFSFSFVVSVTYIVLYKQFEKKPIYVLHLTILTFINLMIGQFLFIIKMLAGLAGNHHLQISNREYIIEQMQTYIQYLNNLYRNIIDESQFYIEFITQDIGDPLINHLMKDYQKQSGDIQNKKIAVASQVTIIGKHWVDMLDIIEYYSLLFHKKALQKQLFIGNYYQNFHKNLHEDHQKLHSHVLWRNFEWKIIKESLLLFKQTILDDFLRNMVVQYKKQGRNPEKLESMISNIEDDEISANQIYEISKHIRLEDLFIQYHTRVHSVYSEQYGTNLISLVSYIYSLFLYFLILGRILLPIIYIVWYKEGTFEEYKLRHTPYEYVLLGAIEVNIIFYEYIKSQIIRISVNRTKQVNALIRMSNMITWEQDHSYFVPKELPTMNIFCIISWTSWFNGRRLITALYETEKLIIDFAYTVIGFYSLIIIIIIVLDYYGSVWEGSPLLKNKLLVYLLGMDFITIASDITKNLFTGCDINMLCENQRIIIREYTLFLNYLKSHFDFIYNDESKTFDEQDEQKKLNQQEYTESKLRFKLAIAAIKREIMVKRSYDYAKKPQQINENLKEIAAEVSQDDISDYIDELKDVLENIQDALEQDSQFRQEKFLGCFPVTYDVMNGMALTLIPIFGTLCWQYIKQDSLNPFDD